MLAHGGLAGCSPNWAAPKANSGAPAPALIGAPEAAAPDSKSTPKVVLAKTQLTNQTGTRVRVTMTMVEVPKDTSAAPKWWWGDSVVLTASYSAAYEFRARLDDRLAGGVVRSALLRVETLLGTRVETTEWYNIVGPVPKRIDFVREMKTEAVVPACFGPSTIEPLARELWPVEQP